MQRFVSILFLLFSLIFFTFPASCPAADEVNNPTETDTLDKRYQQAKFYYNELHTNANLGKSRDNWLNGVRNFRKIYLAGPKSEFGAPSLYMLGRMFSEMHSRFANDIDLQEAISYYRDVAALFPNNRLADDALYAAGNLFLKEQDNPQKAAESYTRIITNHRNGDIYPLAANQLKNLSQEHNIPLPEDMLKHSYLANLSYVLPVKYWSSNDYTRVVIKASGPVTYQEELLEQKDGRPRRLYLDFQQSYIEPRYRAPIPIEDGLLQQIRTAQFTPEVVRVVLDIESISSYKIFSLPDPFRVIIDVRGAKKTGGAEVAGKREELPSKVESDTGSPPPDLERSDGHAPKTELIVLEDFKKTAAGGSKSGSAAEKDPALPAGPKLSLAQQLGLGVRQIVIDPGHGGKDPGAFAFGLREKDVVLKIARKLAPLLEERTGAQVTLTRTGDTFIPLEERTAIANTNDADLFISLHINAHPSASVRGLETYYLNLSTNAEAMRVAAFENSISTHQMSDLQDILSDIMKNSKINESSRLAGFVHNSISEGMKEIQETAFKDLGVKQAPFYVLIGAEMPAILIEIAFITNPEDSEHLSRDAFLEVVAGDIAEGVRQYINSTTASLQSSRQ